MALDPSWFDVRRARREREDMALLTENIRRKLRTPNPERIFYIRRALRMGMTVEEIHTLSHIDPWFLHHIQQIVEMEEEIRKVVI